MGLNEASYMYRGYQDKHFDVCPAAESLRDRLKSGEFGQPDELDLGEWLYQHDVLFGIEKQVIKIKKVNQKTIMKQERQLTVLLIYLVI